MSPLFLTIVGLLYIGAAVDFYLKGNPGMALAFACYAVANYGLMWAAMK